MSGCVGVRVCVCGQHGQYILSSFPSRGWEKSNFWKTVLPKFPSISQLGIFPCVYLRFAAVAYDRKSRKQFIKS